MLIAFGYEFRVLDLSVHLNAGIEYKVGVTTLVCFVCVSFVYFVSTCQGVSGNMGEPGLKGDKVI